MTQERIPDHSVTGSGDTTVFLLHGAFGAKDYWRAQIHALVGAGYRVVAWDAPGYGLSPLPEPFGIEPLARSLGALLDRAGSRRNILLGHSMGGMIAQRAYDFFPDRVHGLALSATSASFGKADGDWQKQFVRDRIAPLDAGKSIAQYAREFLPAMMAPGARGPEVDLVVATVSGMSEATFRRAIVAITEYEGRSVLPAIDVPTLVVSGELDTTAPAQVMEKMAAKIRGAEYVCMEGAGHFGWAEQPARFNGILLDFLGRHFRQQG